MSDHPSKAPRGAAYLRLVKTKKPLTEIRNFNCGTQGGVCFDFIGATLVGIEFTGFDDYKILKEFLAKISPQKLP